MLPSDKSLFQAISASTQSARGLLCALARRGKHLRSESPARAETLLAASRAHPLYKGLRLVFDLLELEDLMLDGDAPPDVPMTGETLRAWVDTFEALSRALSRGSTSEPGQNGPDQGGPNQGSQQRWRSALSSLEEEPEPEGGWPALTSAEYLYDLAVLGVLRQLSRVVAATQASAD